MAPEIALVTTGVEADVLGIGLGEIPAEARAEIVAAHPRPDFKRRILAAFTEGNAYRPQTTFGNVNADVLERFVPDFVCRTSSRSSRTPPGPNSRLFPATPWRAVPRQRGRFGLTPLRRAGDHHRPPGFRITPVRPSWPKNDAYRVPHDEPPKNTKINPLPVDALPIRYLFHQASPGGPMVPPSYGDISPSTHPLFTTAPLYRLSLILINDKGSARGKVVVAPDLVGDLQKPGLPGFPSRSCLMPPEQEHQIGVPGPASGRARHDTHRSRRAVGVTIVNLSILKNGKARAIRFSTLSAICRSSTASPATSSAITTALDPGPGSPGRTPPSKPPPMAPAPARPGRSSPCDVRT